MWRKVFMHGHVLDTPMYGRWVKVANHSPGNPLTLCEVQVEGGSWTNEVMVNVYCTHAIRPLRYLYRHKRYKANIERQ
ncbi:hypothetical protein DPMN_039891 [Dreissena polymorpha]|uniref:Uncharacterized protein n=1 Tax=Dreissena polymorpha TaxID=45954 RepID=A0A9D4HUS9_DREPO|nr:hypothetical protein DPMN_039891 [Dreissena polymorpha]